MSRVVSRHPAQKASSVRPAGLKHERFFVRVTSRKTPFADEEHLFDDEALASPSFFCRTNDTHETSSGGILK
jgi:hypothetical protein